MLRKTVFAAVLVCGCGIAIAQDTAATPPPAPVQHEFTIKNFKTESGVVLPEARIVYGTYGKLNEAGDNAVLKFSPAGELLLRIGQRGKAGNDDDTQFLDRPTSSYHNTATREVFVTDGYGNHRVISFNADTGAFIRMWGAYGKKPSDLDENSFANPVHKVTAGPDGHIYVADRIKNRIQEFELVPGGVRYIREVSVGPGTGLFGAAFDIGFSPDNRYIYVPDGVSFRVWIIDRESFEVLGSTTVHDEYENDGNLPLHYTIVHRFTVEPNGDLLLACVNRGLRRLKFLGVS